MDCIQTENKAVDLFLPGGHGHGFKAKEPGGILATFVSPAWCNGVQEEILNCIRDVGLVPDAADLTQLLQAIKILVSVKTGGVGEVKMFYRKTPPPGWLKIDGTSIGNAASGATQRANADTEALFTHLWTTFTDAEVPIQTNAGAASTRGASAAADFSAGKRIVLADARAGWLRVADDGRGIDAGRVVGSWQEQQLLQHIHGVTQTPHAHGYRGATIGAGGADPSGTGGSFNVGATDGANANISIDPSVGGDELRTRNTAWLLCVSY